MKELLAALRVLCRAVTATPSSQISTHARVAVDGLVSGTEALLDALDQRGCVEEATLGKALADLAIVQEAQQLKGDDRFWHEALLDALKQRNSARQEIVSLQTLLALAEEDLSRAFADLKEERLNVARLLDTLNKTQADADLGRRLRRAVTEGELEGASTIGVDLNGDGRIDVEVLVPTDEAGYRCERRGSGTVDEAFCQLLGDEQ